MTTHQLQPWHEGAHREWLRRLPQLGTRPLTRSPNGGALTRLIRRTMERRGWTQGEVEELVREVWKLAEDETIPF